MSVGGDPNTQVARLGRRRWLAVCHQAAISANDENLNGQCFGWHIPFFQDGNSGA